MHPLPRSFYDRDTTQVAKDLLGKLLVHKTGKTMMIGCIVETEAYLGPHDLAAHSARGRTKRTEVMFGPPGHAYVYLIYGMYHCMNIVTERDGHASAVLIRAVEPIKGITGKTNGPGLLCNAMEIDKGLNGHDLLSDNFFVAEPEAQERIVIVKRPRIGVAYAKHWAKRLLRFYVKGNGWVSKPQL
jgi:DNA-3-methyladenine glycosylase